MIRKKGFTLLELMVTLSIFLILSVMISAILIQGQRILASIDNGAKIQDEVRTALLKIQTEAQKADEVIISDKFGSFNYNQWILSDANSSARELLRFINDGEDNEKVYVEVNENDKHQLIEFSINKLTNEIIDNSKNILISSIEGNDANTINLDVEEISDSKGNKINELVTINCSNIINGNQVNTSEYLISFTRSRENVININMGNNNENVTESPDENNGSGNEIEDSNENNNGGLGGEAQQLLKVELELMNKWEDKGQWKINITNNTGKDINGWSISFYSNNTITTWPNWASIEVESDGLIKLYNSKDSWKGKIGVGQTIDIQGDYYGKDDLNIDIIDSTYMN